MTTATTEMRGIGLPDLAGETRLMKAAPIRREVPLSLGPGMFDGPDVVRWAGVEVGATRVRVGGAGGQTEELSPVERAVLRALMVEAAHGKSGGASDACVSHRSLQRQAGQMGVSGWSRELNIVVTRLRTRLRALRALVRIESVPHVGYRIRDLKTAEAPLGTQGGMQTSSDGS